MPSIPALNATPSGWSWTMKTSPCRLNLSLTLVLKISFETQEVWILRLTMTSWLKPSKILIYFTVIPGVHISKNELNPEFGHAYLLFMAFVTHIVLRVEWLIHFYQALFQNEWYYKQSGSTHNSDWKQLWMPSNSKFKSLSLKS